MRRVSSFILLALFACALGTTMWSPQSYHTQDRQHVATLPSHSHLAGTDQLGRDQATRICLALLLSFGGACCASGLSTALAIAVGTLAALTTPWFSKTLLYLGDLSLTLPWLFLLMLVRAALPLNLEPATSEVVTFALLALLGAPVFLRFNHEKLARLFRESWMVQADAAGLTPTLKAKQVWPHLRPLFWTQFYLFIPACVLAEANLGPLGLGLGEPLPSLGTFLASLQSEAMLSASKLFLLPVTILVLTLIALELSIFKVES